MSALTRHGALVQHFRSQACPIGSDVAGRITGLPGRHLDAWLMSPEICRHLFAKGSECASTMAIVEGNFENHGACLGQGSGDATRLIGIGPLARALGIPLVMVLPYSRALESHLPVTPREAEAFLIDGVECDASYDRIKSLIEVATRRPVLGGLGTVPHLRAELREIPRGNPLPEELVDALAQDFLDRSDVAGLCSLAENRAFVHSFDTGLRKSSGRPAIRVGYARDEAFGGYFPDTLETLASFGAELLEFSPIRDGSLPEDLDLIIIGCGFPDHHIEPLMKNFSMHSALRKHVREGKRVYAEGGGSAYLGQTMSIDGVVYPGVGILPLNAEFQTRQDPPFPVVRTLTEDTWLGQQGTTVRGYCSGRWKLTSATDTGLGQADGGPLSAEHDIYRYRNAVGGLMHLHLAALPEVVKAFIGPHRASLLRP